MEIRNKSSFKNKEQDHLWFNAWVSQLEDLNRKKYGFKKVKTSIGMTHVWTLNENSKCDQTLVIFPGARTTSLFWDFDNALNALKDTHIYLVEPNGLPNLSDGNTPDIHTNELGVWADELFNALGIDNAFVAGASFGGLICMKLCAYSPRRVKAAFLLNPGCLQPFSLSLKNLYYNLLPIAITNAKTVTAFLDQAIFCKPNHSISIEAERLLIEYEVFALKRYNDNTQKPYFMKNELNAVINDTHLLLGDKDILFPAALSIKNARHFIKSLKEVKVFEHVGHGIEAYAPAIGYMKNKITAYS